MSDFHLAQMNTARLRAPMEDPSNREFAEGLVLMNALADRSPGFVWRLADENGDGTIHAPADPHRIYTLSVWETPEHLRAYAYQSQHLEYLRRRREWFHPHGHEAALVLWWIPAGKVPTLRQAISRLGRLQADGPTPEAFTLREIFPAPAGPGFSAPSGGPGVGSISAPEGPGFSAPSGGPGVGSISAPELSRS